MRQYPLLALLISCAGVAAAQERVPVVVTPLAPTDPTTGPAPRPRDCVPLRAHQPSGDVTYRAGVDVNGNPVAPADILTGQPSADPGVPPQIVIDLKRPLGTAAAAGLGRSDVIVGQVSIDPLTGRAALNGRELGPPPGAVVGYSCR